MDSRYNHLDHEDTIYQQWQTAEAFNPDKNSRSVAKPSSKTDQKTSFSIMMPPPNANDPLHIGHAIFTTIEDVLIRYHRMLGDDTLWLPGTDHAGIETQFVFEKKLKKEGKSRFQFDRKTLYQMIWEYVQENSDIAVNQLKKIGASADWSRFKFMLDPSIVEVALATFNKLHTAGLVYRNQQLVNFCTSCGTSYSELEVNYVDKVDPLYYVKYPLVGQPGEFIVVATVRPEPIFVDTHLAVHPTNPKTKHLIGKKVLNPLTDVEMEIIADEFVDPEFGTGIVKLTPAHDPHDYEVAKKHGLPLVSAVDFSGKITAAGGKYAGLKVEAARQQVVADLEAKGLLEKVDSKYNHRIGTCYRCGRVIEPLLRPQFFIKVKELTQPVLTALDNGDVTIHGAGHDKILRHWLENLRDWNISRQIVWGIRIPVWYPVAGNEDKLVVSFIDNNKTFHQGPLSEWLPTFSLSEIESGLQQLLALESLPYSVSQDKPQDGQEYLPETDTFDTWFSSGQWPFATLQTTQPGDFDRFYPTSVMETGYDILPFWVMRMLMLGTFATGQVPFKNVYLHGLVRDQKGQKMSKSKGNVINPLEIIEKYGADALRMALVIRSSAGLDKSVGEPDFKAMRNLTNKLWNAARFIHQNPDKVAAADPKSGDAAFMERLETVTTSVTQQLNDFKIGLAAETLYNEFWHWFCDEAIEQAKAGELSYQTLNTGLIRFLKLFHPFIPFVTETIWQAFENPTLLILESWPTIDE
ncbi:MAG TPA: valine--tRNA ligase [Vitreimonas sp.]|nr:valine--tRNA ligase [Vitreimonas sp.]